VRYVHRYKIVTSIDPTQYTQIDGNNTAAMIGHCDSLGWKVLGNENTHTITAD
jgi:hypothetical protein